jgi:hypothetical protein
MLDGCTGAALHCTQIGIAPISEILAFDVSVTLHLGPNRLAIVDRICDTG